MTDLVRKTDGEVITDILGENERVRRSWFGFGMVRGGRITKVSGQAVSYSPELGLVEVGSKLALADTDAAPRASLASLAKSALRWSAAPLAILAGASPAMAQDACVETIPASGEFFCQNSGGDATTTQTITSGTVSIEIEDGFAVDTSGTATDGFDIDALGRVTLTQYAATGTSSIIGGADGINVYTASGGQTLDTSSITISGGQDGIESRNRTSGTLSLTTGDVSGATGDGITISTDGVANLDTSGGVISGGTNGISIGQTGNSNLNLTVGTVIGSGGAGIELSGLGNGSSTVRGSSGDVVGATDGMYVRSAGGDITVDTLDSVTGQNGDGLDLGSVGGAITVNAVDAVLGTGGRGILADSDGGDITITGNGLVGGIEGTAGDGINADSDGGDIAITGNGDVSGSNYGIFARSAFAGSITIDTSTGSVTSGIRNGIRAQTLGSGALSITTADVTTNSADGIFADNSGTDLTINTSAGRVTGVRGIFASNIGSGALLLTTADVTGNNDAGIVALNSGTSLTIDSSAGSVSGEIRGIDTRNFGSGVLSLTTADVTGVSSNGIYAVNAGTDADLIIDSSAGSVSGATGKDSLNRRLSGLFVDQLSAGTLNITVDQVRGGIGIDVDAATGDTTITLASTAVVTGLVEAGIDARSTGGAITVQGSSGDVVGATDGMYVRSAGGEITVDTLDSVTGNAGDGLDLASAGGAINVNAVDAVLGTGGRGILADSDGGDITITGNGLVGGIEGAAGDGIRADARGGAGGVITITGNGNIAGNSNIAGNGYGIVAFTDGAGSITIDTSAGRVSANNGGIIAGNDGSGALSITTADVTGRSGISAGNSGTDLTIDSSAGSVSGTSGRGIAANNSGSGALSLTTADVTATSDTGIYTRNSGTDLTIDSSAGSVGGGIRGITVRNSGSGAISVTTADVTGATYDGIFVANSGAGADLVIDSSAGSVSGAMGVDFLGRSHAGIYASQQRAGALNITVDQVSGGAGIDANATTGATTITLASTAVVTGLTGIGIDARSTGGAITVQGSSGDVVGATDGMFVRSGGEITVDTLDSVTGNAGDGLDLASAGGAINVNAVDTVLGTGGFGILADSDGGDISITGSGLVGAIEGTAGSAIYANATGGVGGAITITGNGDVSGSNYGISARTDGAGSILVDSSAGSVTGSSRGIGVFNSGSGALSITTADVTGSNDTGILAFNFGTSLTIDSSAGGVSGNSFGITATNRGPGALSLTTADVTGTTYDAIYANNYGTDTDLTIDSSAGSVSGGTGTDLSGRRISGIRANQRTTGSLNITVDEVSGGVGIDANATTGATTITLASTAVVTGLVEAGIEARSMGGAITVQGSSGDVVGATDGMYVRSGGGDIAVDTLDSVTGNAGDGLDLGSAGGAITVNAVDAVLGTGGFGIRADSDGGDITVTGNGLVGGVEGTAGSGILAQANGGPGGNILIAGNGDIRGAGITASTDGAGSITIDTSTGSVAGDINANNRGSGGLSVTTADVTGNFTNGVRARTFGTGLTIHSSAGSVSGRERGIEASNYGSGALSITTAAVAGSNFEAILAINGASATDLTIDTSAGDVSGGSRGILANSQGTGAFSLTTADVTGSVSDGIYAVNSVAGADMLIDTSAGIVSGQAGANFSGRLFAGVFANQQSAGALNITVNQVSGGAGIDANATTGATTITLASTAVVTGLTGAGIDAQSIGGSITVQGSSGDVVGATDGMFVRSMGGDITVDALDSVTGNAGDALDLASAGGGITVNAVDAILGTGRDGILADSDGGDIAITGNGLTGDISGTSGNGITAYAGGGTGGAITITGNGDITASDDGIFAYTNGSGSITIDTSLGSVSGGGKGIFADNFGSGALSITTADVTGASSEGIMALNIGTSLTIDNTAGSVSGATHGIIAINGGSGALSLTTADVTGATYDGIFAINGSGTDVIVDSSAGSVTGGTGLGTFGRLVSGIYANQQNAGTLNITVDQVSGGIGIDANATTGATTITLDSTAVVTGLVEAGIDARSTGGAITVQGSSGDVVGATDGMYVRSMGGVITVDNLDSVTGQMGDGLDLASSGGAITVRDVDAITGIGGNGILADATGGAGGDVLITGVGDVMGSLAGIVASVDGDGTVTAGLTGMTFGAANGFDVSTEGGAVSVNNSGALSGGTFAFIASGANTGPITLANSGTVTGPVQFAGGDDSFTNSGLFQVRGTSDFGAGADMFENLAGGTVSAEAATSLIGIETFRSAGLITLVGQAASGSLSIDGDFVGADGTLELDVDFAGTADQLIIGGAASGTTSILVNDVSAGAGLGDAITLVDAAGGSLEGAFELATQSLSFTPFVALDLTFDAGNNDYLISRRFTSSVAEGVKLAEGAQSLWYRSTDAWAQHRASTRLDAENVSPHWLTFYGNVANREDDTMGTGLMLPTANDLDYSQDFFGLQAGYDLASEAGDGFAAGVTTGYLSSNIRFTSRGNSARFEVFNIGLSASYSSGGFYADGLIKYDIINGNLNDPRAGGFRGDADGDALGIRAQVGYRFGNDGFFIEPQVSLDYQETSLDDIVIEDIRFDFGSIDGLRGIAGLRLGGKSQRANGTGIGYYLGASVVHEFKDGAPVNFSFGPDAIALTNNEIGTYGRIETGMTLFGNGPLSGFIEAQADVSGGYMSYGGQAGVRIKF
ncbi:hypothetical protein [Sphingorhabdus sp. EL138]|uniref:hypothetical protein n=1 Tax=Sphingorhabdus sp. EL138 TaxID=2073156 RepID=UPI000D685583|nr:hypothetical protein [Sphingorhabdus sp. EL138]